MGLDGLETKGDLERFVADVLSRSAPVPERAAIAARCTLGGSPIAFAAGATGYLSWLTEDYDQGNLHDLTVQPWYFTAPVAGVYRAVASIEIATSTTAGQPNISLWKDPLSGASVMFGRDAIAQQTINACVTGDVRCAAGDKLALLYNNVVLAGTTVAITSMMAVARVGG
jgi:hypothetical protein